MTTLFLYLRTDVQNKSDDLLDLNLNEPVSHIYKNSTKYIKYFVISYKYEKLDKLHYMLYFVRGHKILA